MMAVRERAVKVMAALERRVPCLDDFVGQSWSVWTERANLTASEGSDGDEYSKNGKKTMETMTLRKEDMSIFGHYPGQDDFYLVVCSHCSQVVKPQAFEKHCERRHGPLGKLYAHLRSTPPPSQQQRPRHGHTPPSHGATASWSGRNQNVGPPRASPQSPATPPQFRHSKPPKDGVWHSPSNSSNSAHSESAVFKQPPPIEPTRSSPPPAHRDPPWPHGGPSPNRPPPAAERPQSQRGEAASAPVPSGHLRGTKTHKMVSKKECDLDKHCGVLDTERKKVCTRLLTCNIHSIHQRRKVQGRSKNFDQLVAELKMSSKARERVSQAPESSSAPSVSPEPPRDTPAPPSCRRPLTNSPAFRTPVSSESIEEDKTHLEESSTRAHSPLTQAHISGDESEGETNEEPADWHSTPWHPKPAALCSFGSHSLGHGVFTFDRRLHHLRSAMSAMVESHLSAHLWKKIPQASDPQSQSPQAKPAAVPASPSSISQHSKPRAGSHNTTSSLKTSFYSSHGPGKEPNPQSSSTSKAYAQSENSGSSKLGRSPSQSGPGRPKNPVGRPSKQQMRLRESDRTPTPDAAALRKRKASFEDSDSAVSPDKNCVPQNKSRPLISKTPPSASHGQTNGSLSPGSKARPSDSHSPSSWAFKRTHQSAPDSRGLDSGLRVSSFDHKSLGKKRKSSGSSPPSKPHRLPTSPHSGFYTWKESKGSGLSVGGEKKLSTQKPKLHH
ncbi:ataxin-7-like protein 2a isoform X2 [Danio rerio]|uniref:Ataxin-7-like protein 2a isoform X2 n=2 Tax=Danio rerio TaxID=7955 RepID=A0A8M2BK86_DANRE